MHLPALDNDARLPAQDDPKGGMRSASGYCEMGYDPEYRIIGR